MIEQWWHIISRWTLWFGTNWCKEFSLKCFTNFNLQVFVFLHGYKFIQSVFLGYLGDKVDFLFFFLLVIYYLIKAPLFTIISWSLVLSFIKRDSPFPPLSISSFLVIVYPQEIANSSVSLMKLVFNCAYYVWLHLIRSVCDHYLQHFRKRILLLLAAFQIFITMLHFL